MALLVVFICAVLGFGLCLVLALLLRYSRSVLFFLKYGSLKRPGPFVAWLALSTLILIPLLAVLLAQFYSPPFLIGSARYLLSALAQTIAALLAVSFTVAFVIFQVVSNRLTPGAASVIPRNPALHALLAVGAATILDSLAFLAFVADATKSEASVILAKYAPAAAIASLFGGAVALSLVVFSFWRILEYLRPETVLRIHSEAIMKSQRRMAKGRELKACLSDILDELHILTELGEKLCKIEDARSLGFLYQKFKACLAHSLRIYDDAIRRGADSVADINPVRYGRYSDSLEQILVEALRTCDRLCAPRGNEEDARRCWMDMYYLWVNPGLAVYDSQLPVCMEYDERVFGRVVGMIGYLRDRTKRREYFDRSLRHWSELIAKSIRELDARAHRDNPAVAPASGAIKQSYPIEHLIALFRGLISVFKTALLDEDTIVQIKLNVMRDALLGPKPYQDVCPQLLKHWTVRSQDDGGSEQLETVAPTDYVRWIRVKAWSVLIDAGSVLCRQGQEIPGGKDLVKGYFSLLGDVFEQELKGERHFGKLSPSVLEDALELVLNENAPSWRKSGTPDVIRQHLHSVKFWLRLRIYLAANRNLWPVNRCRVASEFHGNLSKAIDKAIEQMPDEVNMGTWAILMGLQITDRGVFPGIDAVLRGLSEALHSNEQA